MTLKSLDFSRPLPADRAGKARRAAEIAAMNAHPEWSPAFRNLLAGVLDLTENRFLINLLVSDRVRMMMGWLALYLDAGYDPSDPLSGLTVNRYKALVASTGLCSPGRAAAMLGIMRFAGYLEPVPRARRGLPLRLVPTEKLVGPQRERMRNAMAMLARIRPESAIGLARIDDPAFFNAFVRNMAEQFLSRERPVEHGPAITYFVDRKSGLMLLVALMVSASEDTAPPLGPMSVPLNQLAEQFAVARSHIKELMRGAVEAGLFVPGSTSANTYTFAPQLRSSINGFFGAMLLIVADAVNAAQAELAAPRTTESAIAS